MRVFSRFISVVFLLVLIVSAAALEPAAVARNAVDLLVAQKYTELRKMLNKAMQETLTEDILRTRVAKLMNELGKPQSFDAPDVHKVQDVTVVVLRGHFAQGALDFQVSVDSKGKIAGLYFRDPERKPEPAAYN
jgi:S-adenosylmethionine:diacylglycerol 3-amino-3-carboxypropyl transferase